MNGTEIIAAIVVGEVDDMLDRIAHAARSREKEVARLTARNLAPGARVRLTGISPKALEGATGTVQSKNQTSVNVVIDKEYASIARAVRRDDCGGSLPAGARGVHRRGAVSKSTQKLFFERLEAALPEGFELNIDRSYANTGHLRIFRTGTFDTLVTLYFSFQDQYVTFQVPTHFADRAHAPLIGDRNGGKDFPAVTFPELESRVISAIINALKEPANAR